MTKTELAVIITNYHVKLENAVGSTNFKAVLKEMLEDINVQHILHQAGELEGTLGMFGWLASDPNLAASDFLHRIAVEKVMGVLLDQYKKEEVK